MQQQAITNTLETNGKRENVSQDMKRTKEKNLKTVTNKVKILLDGLSQESNNELMIITNLSNMKNRKKKY